MQIKLEHDNQSSSKPMMNYTTDYFPNLHNRLNIQKENEKYNVAIFQVRRKYGLIFNDNTEDVEVKRCVLAAEGTLIGNVDDQVICQYNLKLKGVFDGFFEKTNNYNKDKDVYFQGHISNAELNQQPVEVEDKIDQIIQRNRIINKLRNNIFKGYFRGTLTSERLGSISSIKHINSQTKSSKSIKFATNHHLSSGKSQSVLEYYIPIFTTFNILNIQNISLKNSSAKIMANITIQIQMNKQVVQQIDNFFKQQKDWNLEFEIAFKRGKTIKFLFNKNGQEEEDLTEEEYQWDDPWNGISKSKTYDQEHYRLKYEILAQYQVQIDNSHSSLFAPFNQNILKLSMSYHNIIVSNQLVLKLYTCDLQDYHYNNEQPYNPYVNFNDLQKQSIKNPYKQYQSDKKFKKQYAKKLDRFTKINISQCKNPGQYIINDNCISLFPYYKQCFVNKQKQVQDTYWALGFKKKYQLLEEPQVLTITKGYQAAEKIYKQSKLMPKKYINIFRMEEWQHIHLEIPIYRHYAIDLIRILAPLIILSVIVLFVFQQQNGQKDGITKMGARIASCCSLVIAYTAMIPTIRSILPSMPRVTIIQILVYITTISNILAIVSVFTYYYMDYQAYFDTFRAFQNTIFLFAFAITIFDMALLVVLLLYYSCKNYQRHYKFGNKDRSSLRRLHAPIFMKYMRLIKSERKELDVVEHKIDKKLLGN